MKYARSPVVYLVLHTIRENATMIFFCKTTKTASSMHTNAFWHFVVFMPPLNLTPTVFGNQVLGRQEGKIKREILTLKSIFR